MPTALLVEPEKRTITVVNIDAQNDTQEMKSLQHHLQCTHFESAPQLFPKTQTLVPDTYSEAFDGPVPQHSFRVPDRILGEIQGNMLVLGEHKGEIVDCPIKPTTLRCLIMWQDD